MARGRRSIGRAAHVLVATLGLSLVGVVAVPGVSQAAHQPKPTMYYVSLGDSYSIGFQPVPGLGGPTPGYTAYVAKKKRMTLENFGCGGATTSSILESIGCTSPAGTNAVPYLTQTQAEAAGEFISEHAGQIGLITVSIGGNDVTHCALVADPLSCVSAADTSITTNVGTLVAGLRSAAGTSVPIIGLTYPDVLLGLWVYPPGSPNQSLAQLSVTAFNVLINPTLKAAYATVGGLFADVTAATGAYRSLTKFVKSPYGKVPLPVAQVCKLTYYCQLGNIHANTKGYTLEGKLTVRTH